MIDPLVVVLVLLAAAALAGVGAGYVAFLAYRHLHPSIEVRQRELDHEVMLDEITPDQYAEKKIALEREARRGQLERRGR